MPELQVQAIFTGNTTGKVGGWFFPQGFGNGGAVQRFSPPSVLNVRPASVWRALQRHAALRYDHATATIAGAAAELRERTDAKPCL